MQKHFACHNYIIFVRSPFQKGISIPKAKQYVTFLTGTK